MSGVSNNTLGLWFCVIDVFFSMMDCTLSPIVILLVSVRHDPWNTACQQITRSATFLNVWSRRSHDRTWFDLVKTSLYRRETRVFVGTNCGSRD